MHLCPPGAAGNYVATGLPGRLMRDESQNPTIAVVIPCYKVKDRVGRVLQRIGDEVSQIYVVDDRCPEGTGEFVERNFSNDRRIQVLYHAENQGVGGATLTGFLAAADAGADIIVKVDGDGQMDPALIPMFVKPIALGIADYTKGNRFFDVEALTQMPALRLFGNAALSFVSKVSTGYWHTFDPTNGYLAIHREVLRALPVEKIERRYFFESDILFRLNLVSATVMDIPIQSIYSDEVSGLNPIKEIGRFSFKHFRNLFKRIFYNYFLRSFSVASIELLLGTLLILFGTMFGIANWSAETEATAGTVMLAALPILIGVQLVLAFLNFDIQSVPKQAIHPRIGNYHQQSLKQRSPHDH